MGEKRSIFSATLGQVERRLDQLTNPTFDRGTVEVLLSGIMGLMKAEIGANAEINRLAKELAEAHNEIDELNEAIDGYEAEAITARMTMAALRNQLTMARTNLDNGGLKLVRQHPMQPHVDRLRAEMLMRALPDHFQGD